MVERMGGWGWRRLEKGIWMALLEDYSSAGACSTNEHFITKVCSLDEERKLVCKLHIFFMAFHWEA